MTQIELFGCTSVGKSTLARNVFRACEERGIHLFLSEDFVLKQYRLNWVKSQFARTLVIDLLSWFVCLTTWRSNLKFYVFSFITILRTPISRLERLNLARNVLKRIGTYEIVRRRGSDKQVVLTDGGTLQAAHHLFVHVTPQTNSRALSTFVRMVPLPDVAIYVTQSESVVIERVMKRGHKRIRDHNDANVKIFVSQAVDTLDRLAQELILEGRLSVMDRQRNIFVASNWPSDPLVAKVLEIIQAKLDLFETNGDGKRFRDVYVALPP